MFSFMKKEKGEKKEKKERKDSKGSSKLPGLPGTSSSSVNERMTTEELNRLEEVRRSLKIRTRRKEKEKLPSGITADYTANFGLHLEGDDHDGESAAGASGGLFPVSNSESSLNSLSPPDLPSGPPPPLPNTPAPVPPARGILKGKSSYGLEQPLPPELLDDSTMLVENTLKNELIIYEKPPTVLRANNGLSAQNSIHVYSSPRPLSPLDPATAAAIAQASGLVSTRSKSPLSPVPLAFSSPPHPTPSSIVIKQPVEPPGEGNGWAAGRINTPGGGAIHLPLPVMAEPVLPDPRHLTLHRRPAGDFGFSLRRTVVVERTSSSDSPR